jgi:hypothetical protein
MVTARFRVPRCLPLLLLVVGCARQAPISSQTALSNKPASLPSRAQTGPGTAADWIPASTHPPNERCLELDLQPFRNADVDYQLHLEICPVHDHNIVARFVLTRGTDQLKRTFLTWKGTDPSEPHLNISALIAGPAGDAVVVVQEPDPTRTIATAWTFDGNDWKPVFSTGKPHIWVGYHYAARYSHTRVRTCMELDAQNCDEKNERLEQWTWNGSKIEIKPCTTDSCF